jgi:NAD-dependent dihydropyrimidine dehydrogenase PreA subunit
LSWWQKKFRNNPYRRNPVSRLAYVLFNILETVLRFLPIPVKTGLIKIGQPDKESQVFLTGNYHLSVLRVRRALKGQNAYLLVANSRGINVWCAAAGGHLTHHDVISVLELSGVENLVDHRKIILPQLAACGVEAKIVQQKTGWRVVWGPVSAADIPAYLKNHRVKTPGMKTVKFPLEGRLEMAAAWAFPMSIVFSLLVWIFRSDAVIASLVLVWLSAALIFVFFPLYPPLMHIKKSKTDSEKSKDNPFIFLFVLLAMALFGVVMFSLLTSQFSGSFFLFWGIVICLVVLILGVDLSGSTPVLVSGFREEKSYQVVVDPEKCRGAGFCEEVCPRNCYVLDRDRRKVSLVHPDRCIRCGACIIQCPFDAISFVDDKGRSIPPDFVREHKVGFSGKRK